MRIVWILLLIFFAFAGVARADNEGSEKFSRSELNDARKNGDILPLTKILEKLKLKPGDSVLEVEYERKNGKTLYEIYYLDSTGRRHELLVDAATGDLVSTKGDD
jgi:uncharacterized membrane protein YkoI